MIYYMADPMEIMQNQPAGKTVSYRLPSGGIVNAEILPENRVRVVSVLSTDPMDYLNEHLAPGKVLNLELTGR